MIFHENRLLAGDSHEISYIIFFENLKRYHKKSSAAVVIGALRVKPVAIVLHRIGSVPHICLV